jgi:hypothetical protein
MKKADFGGREKMGFFDLLWGWADNGPRNSSGPPLSVEEAPSCFVVRDHNGQTLAYVPFGDELSRFVAKLPTKIEARRIAVNIANVSGLVSKIADSKTVKSSWW